MNELIKKVMENLEKNNMKAFYAETREDVLPLVKSLLSDGCSVSIGGSVTLDECGVREFLEHLKAKGVRICIASAAEVKFIKLVLSKHGILDYFESIISCSDVGVGKDQPDVFFAAEKFLGTPHEETWVFEDSVLAIETAKKADFHVVGVYDPLTFGQDRARELSDEYIDNGGSFKELLPKIN